MDQWKQFSSNVAPIGQRLTKGFGTIGQQVGNLGQQARERFGTVEDGDITELPQEYKDLEARVDGLRNANAGLLRIAKAYDSEAYDYPVRCRGHFRAGVYIRHTLSTHLHADTRITLAQTIHPLTSTHPCLHN